MKQSSKLIAIIAMLFTTQLTQAQDWPNLKRYQEENAKLAAPAAGGNRVVFFGK
jgi:hypothetical protein